MTDTTAGLNVAQLREAIARNSAAVLSLPSAGMVRHHKSRFLAETGEGDGFFVESVPAERPLIDELIATARPAGVAFKGGANKVVFAATIRRRESEYRVSPEVTVEALLLDFPAEVKWTQRRAAYRVAVPAGSDLTARVWRISPDVSLKERPMPAQELTCELRDLSVGGLGLMLLPKDGAPPNVSPDDRLRVELTFRDTSLLLDARLRYPTSFPEPKPVRAGIQFKTLEDDLEGRQAADKLAKIVGHLQRDEVRRHRLGLT